MARITVEDCMSKIDNQYDLVLLAKERTAQLNAGAPMLVPEENDKKTIISLREIGDGKVLVEDLEKSAVLRLRKEPDENLEKEVIEEEENDDFENLYRGQISKSGIAILPSKRTRKIPEVKKEVEPTVETAFKTVDTTLEKTEDTVEVEKSHKDQEPLTLKEEVTE
jgi:DNA-directed RNA polymerase subunit omega